MLEQIIAQPAWFWLCLGGLLLIAELLSAVIYSGLVLLPLSWRLLPGLYLK